MSVSPEKIGPKVITEMQEMPISATLAKCPYCGGELLATVEAWTERPDGYWDADSVDLHCVTEPDIDSMEWEVWNEEHSFMPYVEMLPVCQKVLRWIKENYRFDMNQQQPAPGEE